MKHIVMGMLKFIKVELDHLSVASDFKKAEFHPKWLMIVTFYYGYTLV